MKRCLGCFELIDDDVKTCPYCGYVEGTPSEEAIHMDPGSVVAGRYTIGKALGYGGFGVTYIGWDSNLERRVAIKEYLPSDFSTRMPGRTEISVFNGVKKNQFDAGLNRFFDEAKKLSKFQNEDGIVKIFDCIEENETAYIIMEFLDGETLADRLERDGMIEESEAISLLFPVMKSLDIIHKEGIIHRDISPDNVFLTKDGKVRLIDFGAAKSATTAFSRSMTIIIKSGYSAEEQYRSRSDQGPHTDVYSLAATLYRMITGKTPPDALERRAKIESSKKDILVSPRRINKSISPVTENAILNALNVSIEDRTPTVRRFMDDLTADEPVKRVYGKVNRFDFFSLPLWLRVLIPAVALIIVTMVILFSVRSPFKTSVVTPEGYAVVPNLEGMNVSDAIAALQSCGFDYTTGGNVYSNYIEPENVVYQNPGAGRMIPVNEPVEITISRGRDVVIEPSNGISTIPAYLWSRADEAVADFKLAGLITHVEYSLDDNTTPGQVIGLTTVDGVELDAGDTLEENSEVTVIVAYDKPISVGIRYEYLSDGRVQVSGVGSCTDTNIVIPPVTSDGDVVAEIGTSAFQGNNMLSSVDIPGTVISIGRCAFLHCNSITSVNLRNGIVSIANSAFSNCSITSLVIPSSVSDWSSSAFQFNPVATVVIENGVTYIPDKAFFSCESLVHVDIPNSVTSIGNKAFGLCSSLAYIEIPNGVTTIGDYAFSFCSSLSDVAIPDSVTSVGENAFHECDSLTSINGMSPQSWSSEHGFNLNV